MLRKTAVLAATLAIGCLAAYGCSSVPRIPGITPYKPDIQQGNFVSPDMLAQLKPGMSKEQVRFLLGTPLLVDIFHADRWDYVYWREAPSGRREQRRIAVFFEDGRLARVDGDLAAAGATR